MYWPSQALILSFIRRQQALQDGVQGAIDVPLQLMKKADCCWPHFLVLAEYGNIHALSDLQVRSEMLYSFHSTTFGFVFDKCCCEIQTFLCAYMACQATAIWMPIVYGEIL